MLHKRGSRLRNGDAHTLVVTLIDIIVDSYFPVIDLIEVQIDWLSEKLKLSEHHFHADNIRIIRHTKRKLDRIFRTLRPVRQVVQRMLTEDVFVDRTKGYLRDADNHIESTLEDISAAQQNCDGLLDQMEAYQDKRMNEILYFLTLVTTSIIPMQVSYTDLYYYMIRTNYLYNPHADIDRPLRYELCAGRRLP